MIIRVLILTAITLLARFDTTNTESLTTTYGHRNNDPDVFPLTRGKLIEWTEG
jgi:hypothetical protein